MLSRKNLLLSTTHRTRHLLTETSPDRESLKLSILASLDTSESRDTSGSQDLGTTTSQTEQSTQEVSIETILEAVRSRHEMNSNVLTLEALSVLARHPDLFNTMQRLGLGPEKLPLILHSISVSEYRPLSSSIRIP